MDKDLHEPQVESDEMSRDLTEVDLGRAIRDAIEFMGPGQLGTFITNEIHDTEYLTVMVDQMQANAVERTQKEIPY